jgi:HSP20 family molecular chaperone IbpA
MSRSITLPTTIDPAKVEATYEHGLLKLTIPFPIPARYLHRQRQAWQREHTDHIA